MLKRTPTPHFMSRALLAVALCGLLTLGSGPTGQGQGEEKPAESKPAAEKKEGAPPAEKEGAKGEGDKSAEPVKKFKSGPQLNGYFDRSVLRYARWVIEYRYAFNLLHKTLNLGTPAMVQFSCVLEFGSEAGMAEVAANETAVSNDICGAMDGFEAAELISAAGKLRLKEAIATALNKRLLTARVRQVYLTEFRLARLR